MAANSAHHLRAVGGGETEAGSSSPARAGAEQPSVCAFCYGTGMEVVPGKGVRRCLCRTEDRKSKLTEAALIPRRYSECLLQSYKPAPGTASQLAAFNCAFRLVREYPAVDRGLLFMGTVGVGKLHPSNYPCRTEPCATRDRQGY